MERRRGEEGDWFEEVMEVEKRMQRRERWERIGKSDYNKWYKGIKGEVPGYLRKGRRESRRTRVARFWLGNEMRESKYWEKEEKKRCRLCSGSRETWEHVWEGCREWRNGEGIRQERMGWVLGDEGEEEG